MVEALFLLLGLAFSGLVYYLSIRPSNLSPGKKAGYFLLSLIGIAGMLFLFGIMASFVLSVLK